MITGWTSLSHRARLPKTPQPFDRDVPALCVHAHRPGTTETVTYPAISAVLHCADDHTGPVVTDRLCPSFQRIWMRKSACPRCAGDVDGPMVFLGTRDTALHAIPPLHPQCARHLVNAAPHLAARPDLMITEATDLWHYERRITAVVNGAPRYAITRVEHGPAEGINDLVLAAPRRPRTTPIALWCADDPPTT